MKTKTKLIALALAVVLLVGASVLGTVAYLTANDSVANTFTVGKVALKLDEAKVGADGKALTDEGAARVQANEYKLIPGAVLDKDPTVTVLTGSEPAYVRMLVTINKKAVLDDIGFDMNDVFGGYDGTKWLFAGQTVDGDSMIYEFRYFEEVGAPEGDVVLPTLFATIQVPGAITGDQLASLEGFSITAVAQAIQAEGFADAAAAWAAWQ